MTLGVGESRESMVCNRGSKKNYHIVIRTDSKQLPEVTKGDGGVGLKPEVSIVVSWGQVAALTAGTTHKSQENSPQRTTHTLYTTNITASPPHLGKKILSTTSKSCSRTSLSGFWLRLPMVCVMPNWMAPLRADDVVF